MVGLLAAAGAYAALGFSRATRQVDNLPDRIDSASMIVRVYDVHELLMKRLPSSVRERDALMARTLIFGWPATPAPPAMEDLERYSAENLIDVIIGSIQPESWANNGGNAGYIEYVPGMLIVEQNAQGQAQVAQMLKQLDGK